MSTIPSIAGVDLAVSVSFPVVGANLWIVNRAFGRLASPGSVSLPMSSFHAAKPAPARCVHGFSCAGPSNAGPGSLCGFKLHVQVGRYGASGNGFANDKGSGPPQACEVTQPLQTPTNCAQRSRCIGKWSRKHRVDARGMLLAEKQETDRRMRLHGKRAELSRRLGPFIVLPAPSHPRDIQSHATRRRSEPHQPTEIRRTKALSRLSVGEESFRVGGDPRRDIRSIRRQIFSACKATVGSRTFRQSPEPQIHITPSVGILLLPIPSTDPFRSALLALLSLNLFVPTLPHPRRPPSSTTTIRPLSSTLCPPPSVLHPLSSTHFSTIPPSSSVLHPSSPVSSPFVSFFIPRILRHSPPSPLFSPQTPSQCNLERSTTCSRLRPPEEAGP